MTFGEEDNFNTKDSNAPQTNIQSIGNQPQDDSDEFSSVDEAYKEGFINGEQAGIGDAIYHLGFGYSYDEEPTYRGYESYYINGYHEGYHEGEHLYD